MPVFKILYGLNYKILGPIFEIPRSPFDVFCPFFVLYRRETLLSKFKFNLVWISPFIPLNYLSLILNYIVYINRTNLKLRTFRSRILNKITTKKMENGKEYKFYKAFSRVNELVTSMHLVEYSILFIHMLAVFFFMLRNM